MSSYRQSSGCSPTPSIKIRGSALAVAVATLRKVVTIVLSFVVYPKSASTWHFLGGVSVLSGLVLASTAKKRDGPGGNGAQSQESKSTAVR